MFYRFIKRCLFQQSKYPTLRKKVSFSFIKKKCKILYLVGEKSVLGIESFFNTLLGETLDLKFIVAQVITNYKSILKND